MTTKIEWADETWNPVTGCDKVSPGCDHCYAETIAHRFAGTAAFPDGFAVTLHPERLDQPLRWRRPRRVFVNSMSDLFHDQISDDYIAQVFAVMSQARRHTFQILTKRAGRMRSLLRDSNFRHDAQLARIELPYSERTPDDVFDDSPLPNVWLGVSAENQKWADVRIPVLLDTPAAVRFISAEPLLGSISLRSDWAIGSRPGAPHLNWVIAGGESGAGARPMDTNWVCELRDECQAAGLAFLFKQWGGRTPKAGGRELDGRTWDQYPDEAVPV